jgi:hypothetical protein
MIGNNNATWAHEFFTISYTDEEYASYVRGKTIGYASEVIYNLFGFRLEEHCSIAAR